MAIAWFIEGFAEKYGLKNSLILSVICRYASQKNDNNIGICMNSLSKKFWYLSKEQLRDGIEQLKIAGSIVGQRKMGEFSREIYYMLHSEILKYYLNEYSLSINKVILN